MTDTIKKKNTKKNTEKRKETTTEENEKNFKTKISKKRTSRTSSSVVPPARHIDSTLTSTSRTHDSSLKLADLRTAESSTMTTMEMKVEQRSAVSAHAKFQHLLTVNVSHQLARRFY